MLAVDGYTSEVLGLIRFFSKQEVHYKKTFHLLPVISIPLPLPLPLPYPLAFPIPIANITRLVSIMIFIVRIDDIFYEFVANYIVPIEIYERNSIYLF